MVWIIGIVVIFFVAHLDRNYTRTINRLYEAEDRIDALEILVEGLLGRERQ